MKENEWQKIVTSLATALLWRWWHVPAPMRAVGDGRGFVGAREAAGLADLVMVHPGKRRLIFAELKGTKGTLSPAQKEFLQAITDLELPGVNAYAWWPDDEDEVVRVLRNG